MPVKGNPRTQALDMQASQQMVSAENARKNLVHIYQNEPKVDMKVSPMYQPYFGKVMQVMLNGISIYFKVDGSVQSVPRSFADELEAGQMAIDAIISKQTKMADIGNNHERSPGELHLV